MLRRKRLHSCWPFVFELIGKENYRIPQEDQQTNCFLSLARGRPMTAVPCQYPGLSLSATSLPTEGGRDERDSNNGVGTGERGREWVSETLFCFSSFADNENDLWPIPWGTDHRSRPLLYGQVEP